MEQPTKKFSIFNFQFSISKGVTRVGEPQVRGPVLVSRRKGLGAGERQDPMHGVVLVELLVAFGLASILMPALLSGFVAATQGREIYEQRIAATALVREGEEAVRSLREKSWSNVSTNGTYYPKISGNEWAWGVAADGEVNGFTRTVTISDFIRNGSADPSEKTVVVSVSWPGYFTRSVSSTLYISRWGNISSPPEIATGQLVQQGFGNWCKPSLSTTRIDLIRTGHATSVSAAEISGGGGNKIYTGTGSTSSGPAFSNIIIQGNSPPAASSDTDYNGTPQVKANGIFGEANYAFLATDNRGVEIIDLRTVPYTQIGIFNPNGMKPANSVYVVGNTGYVTTSDKLYIFSISADRTTTAQIGVMSLSNGLKIIVDSGNQYAYVVTNDLTGQLKIIDVHTTPATPTLYSQVAVNGGIGSDVYIDFTRNRAYLATAASVTQPEFFIINITDKHAPAAIAGATYDTNGMDPKGVAIVSANRAVIVGTGGNEYQVFSVDLDNDVISTCPNHSDGDDFLNIDSGVYGVSSVLQSDGHAYSYIVTGDASAELEIIEGGPGGIGGGGGTFESPVFDAGSQVIFNFFNISDIQPAGITVTFKIAVSSNCTTFNFVGSDGTSGGTPYGSTGGAIPTSIASGRCFKYQATFTGGGQGVTSASSTVSVNYSP